MAIGLVHLLSLLIFANMASFGASQRSLGKYNVDRTRISTSGVSSGAAIATQMHVAYSSVFSGVGLVAGNPYYCAQGSVAVATPDCMTEPQNIVVSELTTQTTTYASRGDIDPTNNMYNSRVFIFGGALDTVVVQGVGMKVQQYYEAFVLLSNIKTEFSIQAEHTVPTIDYGNDCTIVETPYLGRCNYDAAYEMLNHFYGNLLRPENATAVPGDFYEFDQREFFDGLTTPSDVSMDNVGYAYVPSNCVSGTTPCSLHVAFHGCNQGRYKVGDEFARHAGYNEVGELNNIIIIYPQAINIAVNMMGCWDWWGYTTYAYATKQGDQPLAVWRMVEQAAY